MNNMPYMRIHSPIQRLSMYGLKKNWVISPSPSKKSSWSNNLKFPSLHWWVNQPSLFCKSPEGEESGTGLPPTPLSLLHLPCPSLAFPNKPLKLLLPSWLPDSMGTFLPSTVFNVDPTVFLPPHSPGFLLPFGQFLPGSLAGFPTAETMNVSGLQGFRAQFWSSSLYKFSASDFT